MSKLVAIVAALLAAGCAARRDEIVPPAAEASSATLALVAAADETPAANPALAAVENNAAATTESPPNATEVKSVEIEDFEDTLVCESIQRSGSRMKRTVCYPREEYAAAQEQERLKAQRYARDLARDTEWREQQRREEEQRRSAAGMVR